MLVEQIWTANAYRNFNYLIACPETGEALAIDPLDHRKCLDAARRRGWQVTQILNTHEHGDHTGGNEAMRAATGARLLAHGNARDKIPGIDRGLGAGDVVTVGRTVELECLDTPGHTMSHVCLLSHTDRPALFCGDTLFNAGAGNCHSGGHPEALYETFANQLARLPDDTKVYPGHDYIENNLDFTLDREPDNEDAAHLLRSIKGQDANAPLVTTLALEKDVNTFFRLHSPSVIRRSAGGVPGPSRRPGPADGVPEAQGAAQPVVKGGRVRDRPSRTMDHRLGEHRVDALVLVHELGDAHVHGEAGKDVGVVAGDVGPLADQLDHVAQRLLGGIVQVHVDAEGDVVGGGLGAGKGEARVLAQVQLEDAAERRLDGGRADLPVPLRPVAVAGGEQRPVVEHGQVEG